ncbi:MAG: hypothetical protein IJ089_04470 [Clostridia bacterium]|nr:hypothetical protein [Clostridia bacterium]
MNKAASNASIASQVAKGWRPNYYLTNMAVAHFQPDDWFVSPFVFPILPVQLSTGHFYKFDKGDLARDNVQRKPEFGKVQPMVFGTHEDLYSCEVDQVIIGLDQIRSQDYQRANTPGLSDPRRSKVRLATEQMKIHMDRIFAEGFFKTGIWSNEYTGVTGTPTGNQFIKFNDANFDPIKFFGGLRTRMMQEGRRKPNVLALGVEAYEGMKSNPEILERVKYSGSTANPATINTNVLAQLLEIDRIVVLNSTYNKGAIGVEDMQFICDPKSALLAYAEPSPGVDVPTAGMTFAWDMLGNGQYLAFDQWEGEKGTHTEYIEGLCSYTPKKVCDELGYFLTACV